MYNELLSILKTEDKILINEPLKNHTSFKIGGNAAYMVLPENADEIKKLVDYLKSNDKRFYIIGNGSNMLFSDEGFDGVIIKLYKNLSDISVNDNEITAYAGATLARIAKVAYDNSLTGFEFASGIPGTLGGAVKMNAGAYDGEMKDVVVSTTYLDKDGNLNERKGNEQGFKYRTSSFEDGEIIISSKIVLKKGDKKEIKEKMNDLNARRRDKQPLEYPSAGSTFKRPEGYFAAKLIDDCGLRGYSIGGAKVSEKHCGFVINKNNATSSDVIALMEHIKKTVYEKTGVRLEAEVKIVK